MGNNRNWFLCSPLGGRSLPPLTQWRGASLTTLNLQTQVLPVLGFFSPQRRLSCSLNWWLANLSLCVACFCRCYSSGYSLMHSFTYCLAASTHSADVTCCNLSMIHKVQYISSMTLYRSLAWPPVHIDQWPNWSSAYLIRVCSCSIFCALGLGVSIQSSPRTENRLQNHTKY